MATPPKPSRKQIPRPVNVVAAILAAGILLAFIGLAEFVSNQKDRSAIRPYRITKASVLNPPTERMLGAIVLRDNQAWFFKVTGPLDQIAAQVTNFRTFLNSVEFVAANGDTPTWELPKNWRKGAGSSMRWATIQIDGGDHQLDLSVTRLETPSADRDGYVISNVNRWRSQLRLPAISSAEFQKTAAKLEMKNAQAMLVDMEGRLTAGAMQPGMISPPASRPTTPPRVAYEAPPGWEPGRRTEFSKAAFAIERDGKKATVTVTDLAAPAGVLLPNVNRWRAQVGLPEINEDELAAAAQEIEVDAASGHYVKLIGPAVGTKPPQAILGVIVIKGPASWFIKLQGDASVAEQEEEPFKKFAQSVKFSSE